jgi:REP element-mobilizing transposase RayT
VEIWHITIATLGRHILFPTEADLRRALHALARVAGDALAHFCIVDDHIHLVVVLTREEAGRLAQRVSVSLGRLAATPLGSANYTPVETRKHLERLVGYAFRQPTRHGLPVHRALWTGSAHLDLLGMRILPGLRLRLGEVLPRFGPRQIANAIGLDGFDLRPHPLADVRRLGAFEIADAASAVFAAGPDLRTNKRPDRRARVAVAALARAAGITVVEVAEALGVWRRSARRLADRRPDARDLHAVRLRLALERHVKGD